jgi:GMP synthase-like glutamine amidotransferase
MMYKVAVLDMYDNTSNLGMASILDILSAFPHLIVESFDVRGGSQVPGTEYDIYISSGGPGDPLDIDPSWGIPYFDLIDKLWEYNKASKDKKYVFFICHSFQLICHHFKLGKINRRRKKSFGVYPTHKTGAGKKDKLLKDLPDPFYVADFRQYQLVQPDLNRFAGLGAEILTYEKIRPHVELERAVMTVRFSDFWVGVQFHPEADPVGMRKHFMDPARESSIKELKGEKKFAEMIEYIQDQGKLQRTYHTILPGFLTHSIEFIKRQAYAY